MAAPRHRVLCVFPLADSSVQRSLDSIADVVICATGSESEIAEHIVHADALIARGPSPITAQHVASAEHLRIIVGEGAGYDHIDVDAATNAGIPVVSGSGVGASAVAEYVIAAMVVGHRRMCALHDAFLSGFFGEWTNRLPAVRGTELTGTVLGIVGFGHIGREIARRAIAAYDVRVVALDLVGKCDAGASAIEHVATLGELLERSQTVSINLPRTKETLGLIGAREIELIGRDGVLVNASRGGIVDEDAMFQALVDGNLKAAVVDVFVDEPPAPATIRKMRSTPNLVATPHVAGATDVSQNRLSAAAVEAVRAALEGQPLPRVVNPSYERRYRTLRD